ncbi:MAG: RpiB/LacA/LacB family sugar-phosphate isomerase [Schleiferiaceae bacterium]
MSTEEAKEILTAFLTNEFEGGRHERRVGKIACS